MHLTRRLAAISLAALAWLGAPATPNAESLWLTLPAPAALPTPTESGMAPVNGVRIHYKTFGAGPPVILLHGGLGYTEVWGNQVAALAADHRVILMDSRGHGRSTRDGQRYTYELMTSDVVGLLDYLKVDKAALVGWSDGGIIGLVMAIKYPLRVSRVFALAANSVPEGLIPDLDKNPTFARYITEAGQEYQQISPTPNDYDGFLAAIGEMWATEPHITDAQLASIKVPVTVAVGQHDEGIRRDHTIHLADTIPNAGLLIMPDVSHFSFMQDPAMFNAMLKHFLDAK